MDSSPPLLAIAAERFAGDERVEFVEHDMARPLPALGPFDAIVSAFAIHHLEDDRKMALMSEVFALLEPGGTFANLEHVSSPTERLHLDFLEAIGYSPEEEDVSNRCVDMSWQLGWLQEAGFSDVDCLWKWREMALLFGVRPTP